MNRRGFFASLVALPALLRAKLAPVAAAPVPVGYHYSMTDIRGMFTATAGRAVRAGQMVAMGDDWRVYPAGSAP